MDVIIPLAGRGTRLRPHTYSKPKPLVKVAGKTILGQLINQLAPYHPKNIIFVTREMEDLVKTYVQEFVPEGFTFTPHYATQEEPLGQAHALWLAKDFLTDDFLVLWSDTLFEVDAGVFADLEEAEATIGVMPVEDVSRFAKIGVDKKGYITSYVEKPPGGGPGLASMGAYFFKKSGHLFEYIEKIMKEKQQTKGEFYLADALALMVKEGLKLKTFQVKVWKDCGTIEALLDSNKYLLEKAGTVNHGEVQDSVLIPPVYLEKGSKVISSVVGPDVSVASGCTIKGSVIRDSILDEEAYIENAALEKSLIGKKALVRDNIRRLNVSDDSEIDFE